VSQCLNRSGAGKILNMNGPSNKRRGNSVPDPESDNSSRLESRTRVKVDKSVLVDSSLTINEARNLVDVSFELREPGIVVSIEKPEGGFGKLGKSWTENSIHIFRSKLEPKQYRFCFEKEGIPPYEYLVQVPEFGFFEELNYPPSETFESRGMFPHRMCLEFEESKKMFLVASEIIGFGRATKTERDQVEISLTRLPLKSEEEDREHYLHNLSIGRLHGLIQMREDSAWLKITSKMRTCFVNDNGVAHQILKRNSSYRIQNRESLMLGTDALRIDIETFRSQGRVSCLKVVRVSDCPHIGYILIRQGMYVGSGPECALCLPKLPSKSACITYDSEVKNFRVGAIDASVPILVQNQNLVLGDSTVLGPGQRLEIGQYCILANSVADVDFFIP
jgi:hypothetical protein